MKFEDAVEVILACEGGYVNHPKDPGGETNFGISKRAYPNLNIAELTREEAAAIYRRDYWDKLKLNELIPELRLMVFDCAVNQGPGMALSLLRKTLAAPSTQSAFMLAEQHPSPSVLKELYADNRLKAYKRLATFNDFGRGWVSRLMKILSKV